MDIEDVLLIIERLDVDKTTKLSLSNKDIVVIPPEIKRLKNLQHLDLSYNNIREIPRELFELSNLETLLLFRNNIEEMPELLGKLKNIHLLDISYNKIETLPDTIGELSQLKTLDAGHCKIRSLPLDFIKLLSLKDLYLEENALEFPPAKVVSRGLYATMYHLAQEKKKRDAAKVVVQVYNLPDEIHTPFRQYIECFNDVVSQANQNEVRFDVKFINQYLQSDIELQVGTENYLYEFLKFIRENINSLKEGNKEKMKLNMFDLQVMELRNEITNLNESLQDKFSDIKSIQEKIENFTKILDSK